MADVRRRGAILLFTWILMLVATLSFLSYISEVFYSSPNSNTILSVSWAGYIVANETNPELEVVGVSASWIVPTVNASGGNGYSSAWIGIGGQTDKTLIQVGTEHDIVDGQPAYRSWYEMLPDYAITINTVQISPGDTVYAAVTLVDEKANRWNIQLSDQTNGQTFNQNFIYQSTRSSAEWIVERPTVNNQLSSLNDFGAVAFSGCIVNTAQAPRAVGNFTYATIEMSMHSGAQLTSVSELSDNQAGFTVTYRPN